MSLEQQLFEDMKQAMKAKDKIRLETIRDVRAGIKNAFIKKGGELSDEEILQIISTASKKRRESIEQFKAVNREDRADIEYQELQILQSYLPKQLNEAEINDLLNSVFEEVKPESIKDMGKVMGRVMPKVKGIADGKLIQQLVKEKLSGL